MYTFCVKALEHLPCLCFTHFYICFRGQNTDIWLCIEGEVIWQEGSAGHSQGLSHKTPAHSAIRTFRGSHSESLSLLMTVAEAPHACHVDLSCSTGGMRKLLNLCTHLQGAKYMCGERTSDAFAWHVLGCKVLSSNCFDAMLICNSAADGDR